MSNESLIQDSSRPYTPPSNVVDILQRLRSRNIPDKVDSEYLRDASIPSGTVSRTFFALRFLGLVEASGEPSPDLVTIGISTDEEYKRIMERLMHQAYKDVFDVIDPSTDNADQIENVFRRFTPASQRRRMVIFFLGMCREAGMPLLEAPRQRSSEAGARSSRSPRSSRSDTPSQPRPGVVRTSYSLDTPGEIDNIAPALQMLVSSLPPVGHPLSRERREQWLNMAEATLAFVYPETPDTEERSEKEDESEM